MRSLAPLLLLLPSFAIADAGMWPLQPFDRLPHAQLKQSLGVQLDEAWVRHAMQSAVNVGGASGGFVSPRGLVLTNHHVARSCIARLSTPQDDIDRQGFTARTLQQERRCPGLSVRLLQGVEDVTAQLPAEADARRSAIAQLEASCTGPQRRCEVVALYGGALQHLYRYAEHDDVRLAFAPEAQAANFGGDDDNFNFPRYSFDLALLRVYAGGQPITSPAWLRAAQAPLQQGEPVFAVGHPGRTERLLPMAMLEAIRDVQQPLDEAAFAHEADALIAYGQLDPESARQMDAPLDGVQNRLKSLRGEGPALHDPTAMARKRDEEARVRAASPGDAVWREAEAAARVLREQHRPWRAMQPMRGSLIAQALSLVTLRDEAKQPTAERLRDFSGGRGAREQATVRAQVPHPPALEVVRLRAFIERAEQLLGKEHPFVRELMAAQPDAQTAARHWLDRTQMGHAPQRAAWLDADAAGFERATDPLLQLARRLHEIRRPVLLTIDRDVDQRMKSLSGPIAQARWKVLGDAEAPDATGSLRVSFGRVKLPAPGRYTASWKATLGGAYARAHDFNHQAPFDLAPRLVKQRQQLPMDLPLNFTSDADIIGGNSGSPVLNAKGEWVGLAFDGNLDSLAGRFYFDGRSNRMSSVTREAVFLALEKLHPEAAHLAREMRGRP